MLIIQNVALLNLTFDEANRVRTLDDNRLRNTRIVAVMAYSGTEDFNHTLPYNDYSLPNLVDLINGGLFLRMMNEVHNNTMHVKELNLPTVGDNRVEYLFNEKFDLDKSFIEIKGQSNAFTLPVYVFYKTRKLNKDIEHTNSVTYYLESDILNDTNYPQTIKLSDIVGKELEGKDIKRILVSDTHNQCKALGYLDLVGKDSTRKIEMLPLSALHKHNTHNIYFDPINIDWEKSTLRNDGKTEKMAISFFY